MSGSLPVEPSHKAANSAIRMGLLTGKVQPQEMLEEVQDQWVREKVLGWGISAFTDVQRKAIEAGVLEGKSMIVSAPTSSGKTLVAELACLAALQSHSRVVYLVSHRALADQKYLDFRVRFGEQAPNPIANVCLSTGDRSEGDVDAQIRVATYEKAIGLILSGQIAPENTLIIADELQIICDPTRGPEIETLCAIFRQRGIKQFIALTATVENPKALADWMNCALVQSGVRGTPLRQEIWYGDKVRANVFGEESAIERPMLVKADNLSDLVTHLLAEKLGPVLVFSETKKEAAGWAADFVRTRPRSTLGIALSDQLELFSEPTEFSEKLRQSAERGVAFHTSDLSAQERQVLEQGFLKSQFDVCFATTTLAAGVNFPFRTIVFPKLSFQYREPGAKLGLADYRNMSGRAGRLGLHADGLAVLTPKGPIELDHAQALITPKNEVLSSVLLKFSVRKVLLSLVASRVANTLPAINDFFQHTLYWQQVLRGNPKSQAALQSRCREALDWLIRNKLVVELDSELKTTQLGRAAAISGLLPETAVQFAAILERSREALIADAESLGDGLILACCSSGEFRSEHPPRFLPFVSNQAFGGVAFWKTKQLVSALDTADQQLLQCAQAISLYTTGLAERKIAFTCGVSAGAIQRLAFDVAWVLEGLQRIATTPDMNLPQTVSNQIGQLARRVRWGVPTDTLDMLRVAEKHRVPGVGRQRAMELVKGGYSTFQDLLAAGKDKLLNLLKHSLRVDALLESASANTGLAEVNLREAHIRIASAIGLGDIVERSYAALGVDYEKVMMELLEVFENINATVLDTSSRPNVPDLLLKVDDTEALVECKTSGKAHGLISKEDAWAVLQKAADFAPHPRRVTLGKFGFDESALRKAAVTKELTLIQHDTFIEGLLRLRLKEIDSPTLMRWLVEPGLSELERLPGKFTYQLR